MNFRIDFWGPFRVATGASGGDSRADTTVDPTNPLPASSLKGVMRAAAVNTLRLDDALVTDVFGGPGSPCAWSWSSAVLDRIAEHARARVSIDPETGTAVQGALLLSEELWPNHATFTVTPLLHVDEERRRRHTEVLVASAHAVTSLGSDRRRGFGWVSITSTDVSLSADAVARLVAEGGRRD